MTSLPHVCFVDHHQTQPRITEKVESGEFMCFFTGTTFISSLSLTTTYASSTTQKPMLPHFVLFETGEFNVIGISRAAQVSASLSDEQRCKKKMHLPMKEDIVGISSNGSGGGVQLDTETYADAELYHTLIKDFLNDLGGR